MYEILKETIENTNYKLEEMLDKIYVLYAKNKLTKEEMEELEGYAKEKANTDNSIDILNKLKEMDLRMQNCETRLTKLENPEGEELTVYYSNLVTILPGKWYYNGDPCSENGKNYICIAPEGQVCVWSPSEYPAYWQEVVEESEG